MRRTSAILFFFLITFFFGGCKSKGRHYIPVYSNGKQSRKILLFGVPSQSYYELCDSVVKYLNDRLQGAEVQTVATSSFAKYNDHLVQGYYDFTIANGLTALNAEKKGYSIVGRVIEPGGNSGSIVVNKDSAINSISDLKGKTVATPGPPALPGHMLQMLYLNHRGINVNQDLKFKYLESFESVFLNVYLGKCSAGFATTTSWNNFLKKRPEIGLKVVTKWQTEGIIGNAILLRTNMDKQLAARLKQLFLSMDKDPQGRRALVKLGLSGLGDADSNSYRPLQKLAQEYNSTIIDHNF